MTDEEIFEVYKNDWRIFNSYENASSEEERDSIESELKESGEALENLRAEYGDERCDRAITKVVIEVLSEM